MSKPARRAKPSIVLAALAIFALWPRPAPAQDFYWENPRPLTEAAGAFPTLLQLKDGIVAIWQESESRPNGPNGSEDHGQAWLSLARLAEGEWQVRRRFAGPFDFRGSEPIAYSADGEGSRIAIAAATGDGQIEVLVSQDGGESFTASEKPAPGEAAVAPRIFLSASGGYLLFVTQGKNENLNLSCATSSDGVLWKAFQPFIGAEEKLSLNFLPAAGRIETAAGPRDIVVFQSLLTSARPTFQLYAKTSADGGATWSKASRLTTFLDPVYKDKPEADNFDNERPFLAAAGGRLWLAWERRPLGGNIQIYAAPLELGQDGEPRLRLPETDLVSTNSGSGSCSAPQVLELEGRTAVSWFDNRKGTNRVYLAQRRGVDWVETELSSGTKGNASFGKVAVAGSRPYAVWQTGEGEKGRIIVLEPDTVAAPPILAAQDFSPGKRTRRELATVQVTQAYDSSGIEGYSWIWGRDPAAEPPRRVMVLPSQKILQERADADGAWYLAVAALDYAGNWSKVVRLRFDRDTVPPEPPLILPAPLDDSGYLASNSFALEWLVPDSPTGKTAEEVAGYSWELRYIGGLERQPAKAAAALAAAAKAEAAKAAQAASPGTVPPVPARPAAFALPGLNAYEAALVARSGPPLLPPAVLGAKPRASWNNVDDGYYLFSVSAIDTVGNIGAPASILIRANKFVPYTAVSFADSSRDDFGRQSLTIRGRGFSIDGYVERVVLDRDGREPYDVDKQRGLGGFRIASDREITGLEFEDLPAGNYRIGVYHPGRGWYWTGPVVAIDTSGTLKFGGEGGSYVPSWKLLAPKGRPVSVYDIIVAVAALFAGLGILLSARQAARAAREMEEVRLEVLALVQGGPMPKKVSAAEARRFKRRGMGLRLKFTLIIASLVLFVVLLVALLLGYSMINSESEMLSSGLEQRAMVLLESVSQGARSYLPAENLLELGFLPGQKTALDDAVYITVTGYGSGSTTDYDVVWASNDPDILKKIDTATLQPGVSRLTDGLSPKLPSIVKELNDGAAKVVGEQNAALAAMTQEGRGLATKLDAASQKRLAEISTSSRAYEAEITGKLSELAKSAVSSNPPFDPKLAAQEETRYLFYKPVMYRRGQDQLYYRGMVRLEVSTEKIVQSVRGAQADLIRTALYVAAAGLALGILGSILLSSIIVNPIKKLVKAIETIRDTEDKEELEGLKIEVASRDEIFTLADTVNQMTEGLVKAAKASKELVVGKGIQKMFIPLDAAPSSSAKLSTGRRVEKDFEVFGYYEGADAVSGDYWDFRSINDRYHYFIKCDVSGHGVSAALIMVQVATMLINYFNDWKKKMPAKIDTTEIAYRINDFLEERQFKGRFAAFTLGVWDSKEGLAYLTEAGDRKLHIWKAAEGRLVEETLPDSPAAGPFPSFMVEMKQPFVQVVRKLEKGDALILYTDGIDEANRHFRDSSYRPIVCEAVPKDEPHGTHKGGVDNEDFGYERICAILEAIHTRGTFRLERAHTPDPDEVLSFDFSGCEGSLEEMCVALFAVEKVFRMYRDPSATAKDFIVVDAKVDEFLRRKRRFDQVRLFLGPDDSEGNNANVAPLADANNPGYVLYKGLREDPQDDDLTFLGIMRK